MSTDLQTMYNNRDFMQFWIHMAHNILWGLIYTASY